MNFSVIIPTYNRANYINQTIQTVLNQDYLGDYEIIVVDDGSTDTTEEVVRYMGSPKIKYYKKTNEERAAARNFGIQKATGEYITFLDSDDILYPDYLKNATEMIEKYQNPPFFHLAYQIITPDGHILYKINQLKSDDLKMFVRGNPLSCMGVFLHQSVTQKFLFNPERNLAGSEDWEYWFRLFAHYGLKTDNRISSALINHENRSVLSYSEEKLVMRKNLAIQFAFSDKVVQSTYTRWMPQIEAFWDVYIALHLTLSKKKKAAIKYLFKAFLNHPAMVFRKRFWAVVKHLVL
jgi:glycosyltransferase involved in cell wall biosynthesis